MDSGSAEFSHNADAVYAGEVTDDRQMEARLRAAIRNLEEKFALAEGKLGSNEDKIRIVAERQKEEDQLIASKKRQLRLWGLVITVFGVGSGLLLIWIGTKLSNAFFHESLIALGTGAMTAGTVGVVAALVGPMINPTDKANTTRILSALDILIDTTNDILIGLRQAEVEYRSQLKVDSESDPRRKLSWFDLTRRTRTPGPSDP
jgi:hypothetical protein